MRLPANKKEAREAHSRFEEMELAALEILNASL